LAAWDEEGISKQPNIKKIQRLGVRTGQVEDTRQPPNFGAVLFHSTKTQNNHSDDTMANAANQHNNNNPMNILSAMDGAWRRRRAGELLVLLSGTLFVLATNVMRSIEFGNAPLLAAAAERSRIATTLLPSNPIPLEAVNSNVIIDGISYPLEVGNATDRSTMDQAELLFHLPLPKPILVVGMPKAGTTTIHSFFEQAGYNSVHWHCPRNTNGTTAAKTQSCGLCIRKAIANSLPPLETCGQGAVEVWAQMDVQNSPSQCHFPQITDLERFHQEAPNATLILNRRNIERWVRSVEHWKLPQFRRVSIAERLARCPDGPVSANATDLAEWHRIHIQRIRDFVQRHPSHALIEIDIEDPTTAQRMATLFQTKQEYWGHANHNEKVVPS
jgi:hypothetical protein